jgi:hypothetical protein
VIPKVEVDLEVGSFNNYFSIREIFLTPKRLYEPGVAKPDVRFGALEEVFMSYKPHGAWRTMEVLEELA